MRSPTGQLVAIDGKTLSRSFDAASSKSAIHMVSAWATANHISLGQVVVDAKSNEITAIPKLLEISTFPAALVTIDAMGCQTEIAEAIVAGGADYVLAAKGNQPTLYDGIQKFFDEHLETDFAKVNVSRHKTEEQGPRTRGDAALLRMCRAGDFPMPSDGRLKAIGVAISDTLRDGKDYVEVRYYILSKYLSAKSLRSSGAWPLGDREPLHWQLDVTFDEDQCRCDKDTPTPTSASSAARPRPAEERTTRQGRHQEQTPRSPAGTTPTSNKSSSGHDLWCNRPALQHRFIIHCKCSATHDRRWRPLEYLHRIVEQSSHKDRLCNG